MKIYYCKECERRGKKFEGNRFQIRNHLREDHLIKCWKNRNKIGSKYESKVTSQMGSYEI